MFLARRDLTSSYMVPFSYIHNCHYKSMHPCYIECMWSNVYIVTVSASLLVILGTPAHLIVVQPIDLSLAIIELVDFTSRDGHTKAPTTIYTTTVIAAANHYFTPFIDI